MNYRGLESWMPRVSFVTFKEGGRICGIRMEDSDRLERKEEVNTCCWLWVTAALQSMVAGGSCQGKTRDEDKHDVLNYLQASVL